MTGKERNKVIVTLIGAVIVGLIVGIAMFIGMMRDGATSKTDSEQIACGVDHMLLVDDSGDVWATGHNAKGELGDVTCDNKTNLVEIEIPKKVVQVAAGDELSFALCSNGDLYAWGDNTSYQMGDGMNISRMEPEKMMENVAYIAAGHKHALAITKDNALYVWGRNKDGALGIADSDCDQKDEEGYACQSIPYKLMDDVVSISAGLDYSMAVTSDSTLYAWGADLEGQLGITQPDSTNADGYPYQSVPAKVMDGVNRVVCGGRYHALAIMDNSDLYAWGKATVGSISTKEVDNTTDMIQTTPIKIMEDVSEVAAGSAHTIALKTDGTAWGWGVNNYGQIGLKRGDATYSMGEETIFCQVEPYEIADNIQAISAGGFMSVIRTNDGLVKSFGCNLYGQLGIGSKEDKYTPTYVPLK